METGEPPLTKIKLSCINRWGLGGTAEGLGFRGCPGQVGAGGTCCFPEYFQASTASGKVGPGSVQKPSDRQRPTEKARSPKQHLRHFRWSLCLRRPPLPMVSDGYPQWVCCAQKGNAFGPV